MASQDVNSQRISLPGSWASRPFRQARTRVQAPSVAYTDRLHGLSWSKRALDVCLSTSALILTAPLALLTAAVIKLTSEGPVFFTQERVGLNRRVHDRRESSQYKNGSCRRNGDRRTHTKYGRPFTIYKFRTMVVKAENGNPQFAAVNDPRVTRVGRLLRKTRIDEIPQFFNVLKGEMSIVGPRPERAYFIEQIDKEVPEFRTRLRAKPGITGLAQVNVGYCNTTDGMKDKLNHDLEYIRNLGAMTDLKILARTVGVVVTGRGAY